MAVHALDLERDGAQGLRQGGRLDARQLLHDGGVRQAVPDGGIAGDRLGDGHAPRRPGPEQQLLGAAPLVAELDLQVVHRLAVALKAEMPGLDDAGVDRPDRDLVHAVAFHREEGVRIGAAGSFQVAVAPQGLEPRVLLRQEARIPRRPRARRPALAAAWR